MKTLVYFGGAKGQAARIRIDGVVYSLEDEPFKVSSAEAAKLLKLGGFMEIKPEKVLELEPEDQIMEKE